MPPLITKAQQLRINSLTLLIKVPNQLSSYEKIVSVNYLDGSSLYCTRPFIFTNFPQIIRNGFRQQQAPPFCNYTAL